jgi:hypothetical protein
VCVLELLLAEIADLGVEPRSDLPIGVVRQADRPGQRDPFEARGDIDTVAHKVAVALLDTVAEMDADTKLDALSGATSALRSTIALWTSTGKVHRVTTLRNSMMLPSPVRLTMPP